MFRPLSERRLVARLDQTARRLTKLREELRVADEQHRHFADEADDARLRAIVGDSPMTAREHRDAARHAEASERHRRGLVEEIQRLERQQDELLDRLPRP
jgi:hypothetical protein